MPRLLTVEERKEMESKTRQMHADVKRVMANRPRRYQRKMVGFFSQLTPEQRKKAVEYKEPDC